MTFLGIRKKVAAPGPREIVESTSGAEFVNGSTPALEPERSEPAQAPQGPESRRSNRGTFRDPVVEASRRVADLENRLSGKRQKVAQLVAQLDAVQDGAVEAAVRGEEPASFIGLEVALRDAQAGEQILERALNRAKALLGTAEEESKRAAQAEQDERFVKTLRELMERAEDMAECQSRLSEIHKTSGGRYPSSLLWSAFGNDYEQWLSNAEDFLSKELTQGLEP